MLTLYGIPTCDSCRKARKSLDARGVAYAFVNLKEQTPSANLLEGLFDAGAISARKMPQRRPAPATATSTSRPAGRR